MPQKRNECDQANIRTPAEPGHRFVQIPNSALISCSQPRAGLEFNANSSDYAPLATYAFEDILYLGT
jgi:hypothetical protein